MTGESEAGEPAAAAPEADQKKQRAEDNRAEALRLLNLD